MSNLSELLPTGGGQNAVDFVAFENITAGQAVALRSDGQIEVVDAANVGDVIGLAAEAITSGNTGAVNVFGGINEAQSGLTIGSDYYVDNTGTISTAAPTTGRKLGKAVSATTLNLLDYPSVVYVAGQQAYTTAGTYSWVAPASVSSVSVVAIGGGASGGGGLGWKNDISVTAGNSYTVVIGSGASSGGSSCGTGGDSYFIDTDTVKGGGAASNKTGGTYTGDGGGNGGDGFKSPSTASSGFGGGGAGGYSGSGGNGGSTGAGGRDGTSGAGGGAGGGGSARDSDGIYEGGAGGGGVGILGEGSPGSGGSGSNTNGGTAYGGGGGSGGGTATNVSSSTSGGALYGGGGGYRNNGTTTSGAAGAVRIIWGAGRAFPSTNTGDV